jgi:hypothetical protein
MRTFSACFPQKPFLDKLASYYVYNGFGRGVFSFSRKKRPEAGREVD